MKPARRQTTSRTPETSEGNQPSDGMRRPMHSPALPVVPTCVKGIPTTANTREGLEKQLAHQANTPPQRIDAKATTTAETVCERHGQKGKRTDAAREPVPVKWWLPSHKAKFGRRAVWWGSARSRVETQSDWAVGYSCLRPTPDHHSVLADQWSNPRA